MTDPVPASAARLAGVHDAIAEALPHGGFLRCEVCRRRVNLGDSVMVARYLRNGWPKCHNLTMRWWTQRQILNGEAPSD